MALPVVFALPSNGGLHAARLPTGVSFLRLHLAPSQESIGVRLRYAPAFRATRCGAARLPYGLYRQRLWLCARDHVGGGFHPTDHQRANPGESALPWRLK